MIHELIPGSQLLTTINQWRRTIKDCLLCLTLFTNYWPLNKQTPAQTTDNNSVVLGRLVLLSRPTQAWSCSVDITNSIATHISEVFLKTEKIYQGKNPQKLRKRLLSVDKLVCLASDSELVFLTVRRVRSFIKSLIKYCNFFMKDEGYYDPW